MFASISVLALVTVLVGYQNRYCKIYPYFLLEFRRPFMKVLRRFDSPIITLVIVAIAYAIFLNARLSEHQYDFSVFVTAGDIFVDANAAPDGLKILQNSDGYDGQFYYRLALTPFTEKQIDFGIRFDYPAYRQARILYPLLARLFALGQTAYMPVALILVNYLALCMIAWLGARFAQRVHHNALWGLAFALYPGFLFTLSRDTTEIVAMAFLLAAILFLHQQSQYLAGLFLVLAFLTRETILVVPFVLLMTILFARKRQEFRNAWFPATVPIISYVLWRVWLEYNWRHQVIQVIYLGDGFGIPFVGLFRFIDSIFPPIKSIYGVWLIETFFLILLAFAVVRVFSRSASLLTVKISWCIYITMMLFLNQAVWVEDWGFLRVQPEIYLLGVIILLEAPSVLKRWIFSIGILSWVLLGINLITR